MTDYSALDEAILVEIRAGDGRNTFQAMAKRLQVITKTLDPENPWRALDRRLQVLRKRGAIEYRRSSGSWGVASEVQ